MPESEGRKENGIALPTSHNECLRADVERVGSFLDHPEALLHHQHPADLHQEGGPILLVPLLHLEDLGLAIPLHGLPPGLRIDHPGGPSVVLSPDERGIGARGTGSRGETLL